MKALYSVAAALMITIWCDISLADEIHKYRIDLQKPYLTLRLTYNYEVYKKPIFFKPKALPSFVAWVEEKESGFIEPIFITDKAANNKWTFTRKRPEVMPIWDGVKKVESAGKKDIDAVSAATPKGDLVTIYWQIPEALLDKKIEIYIEANNAFDYNAHYHGNWGDPRYSAANGQPSVVWKAWMDLGAEQTETAVPGIIGHGHVLGKDNTLKKDLSSITTAAQTFSDISIRVVTPYTSLR